MKRRTLVVAVVIGVAAAFIIPYFVYATDYAGEYSVTVKFDVTSPVSYEATVTEVEITSEPMTTMSFWDVLLKGHPPMDEAANYTAFVTLNQTGDVTTQTSTLIVIPFHEDEPTPASFTFYEMKPGETTVRIYIQHTYLDTITFDQTWTVMVG